MDREVERNINQKDIRKGKIKQKDVIKQKDMPTINK
jgi:hypothetical protein